MDMGMLSNRAGVVEVKATTARTNEVSDVIVATGATVAAEERKYDSVTEPDREQMLAAVTDMQKYVQAAARNIQFQLDDASGRMVVTVTEAKSGEVIRQMPSEEALRLAENLSEMRSVLFTSEV